jgi:hypothetical protein
MKKILLITVVSVLLSCKKEYKYEIKGKVYIPSNGSTCMHDAIWYTDTIGIDGDTLYYFNSDGSEVRIYPPFILKENY